MLKVIQEALTFDDVLLVPDASNILPSQASLKTQLTSKIQLNIPQLRHAHQRKNKSMIWSAEGHRRKNLASKFHREAGAIVREFSPSLSNLQSSFFTLSCRVKSASLCELLFLASKICSQCKSLLH